MVSFSSFSRVMENQLQTHLKELLSGVELDNNRNSSRKPCERLLKIKQLDQKIKQFHEVEIQESSCIPWVNIVHLTSKRLLIKKKVKGTKTFEARSFLLLLLLFSLNKYHLFYYFLISIGWSLIVKDNKENTKIKVATLEQKVKI